MCISSYVGRATTLTMGVAPEALLNWLGLGGGSVTGVPSYFLHGSWRECLSSVRISWLCLSSFKFLNVFAASTFSLREWLCSFWFFEYDHVGVPLGAGSGLGGLKT